MHSERDKDGELLKDCRAVLAYIALGYITEEKNVLNAMALMDQYFKL